MRATYRKGIVGLAVALVLSGCYGPFNLTRRLHHWNGQIGGKWEQEFVFIVLAWVPVYSLAVLGDAILFNSMQFWTGDNPVDPPMGKSQLTPKTRRLVRGSDEALLTYTPTADGTQLLIEQFQKGEPAGSLRLAQRDGLAVGTDAEGRVLFTARSLPDGGVLVHDAKGTAVASYSADQVARMGHGE